MEVIVKSGQTLSDVGIQEMGSFESAVDMAMKNNISLTDNLSAGDVLQLPSTSKNKLMQNYCKANDVSPATLNDRSNVRLRIFTEEFTPEYC